MTRQRRMSWIWVSKGVGMVVVAIAAGGALGYGVMALWNCLMPELFGLKPLHFWQAVGLLVLSRVLFGGFHRSHGGRMHRRHGMFQRWENMTPEQRERFRHGFRGRFCQNREPGQ